MMDTLSRNNFYMSSWLTRIMHEHSKCIILGNHERMQKLCFDNVSIRVLKLHYITKRDKQTNSYLSVTDFHIMSSSHLFSLGASCHGPLPVPALAALLHHLRYDTGLFRLHRLHRGGAMAAYRQGLVQIDIKHK